jgi:hypothetical protein
MYACVLEIGRAFFERVCAVGPRPHIAPDPPHLSPSANRPPHMPVAARLNGPESTSSAPACSIEYASDVLLAAHTAAKKRSALDEAMEFVQETLKDRAVH